MDDLLKVIKQLLAGIRTDEAERVTWQLLLRLLTHIEPTQPRKPIEEVPLLKPLNIPAWKDFRTLISDAVRKGAINSGGFLVDVPGFSWKKPEGSPKITFHRPQISRKPSGPLQLETEALPTYNFDLQAHLVSWPRHPTSVDLSLRAWAEFDDLIATTLSYNDALKCPPYATNCDAVTPEERRCLGLSERTPLSSLDGNLLSSTCETYAGIHTPEAFVSTGLFTPFGAHQEDAKLLGVNYLAIGAPKLWIIIPEHNGPAFEQFMISRNNLREHNRCGQFVRHSYSFPSRHELENADIEYSLIWQQQHQAVVVLPGVYHFGINMGPNIAEAVNYDDGSLRRDYVFCSKSTRCPNGPKFISAEGLQQKPTPILCSQSNHVNNTILCGPNRRGKEVNRQSHQRSRPAGNLEATESHAGARTSNQHPPRPDSAECSAAAPNQKKRPIARNGSGTGRPGKRQKLGPRVHYGAHTNPTGTTETSIVVERRLPIREDDPRNSKDPETNDVSITLQDLIKKHRVTETSAIRANREGLRIPERLRIVQDLTEKVNYFKLLRRCHLVELYIQTSGPRFKHFEPMRKQEEVTQIVEICLKVSMHCYLK